MLTAEGQKLNSRDDTEQGLFLIRIQDFTVPDMNPNQVDRQFYTEIKPHQNSKQSLQRKRGLLSVLFNLCDNTLIQTTEPLLASLCNFNEVGAQLPQDSERLEERV